MSRIRQPITGPQPPAARGRAAGSALQRAASASGPARDLRALQSLADRRPLPAQRAGIEEEELQAKAIQRAGIEEELQAKFIQHAAVDAPQRKPDGPAAGLPGQLRAGVEALSGQALGDVKVHYDSPRPAELAAHAYAQGDEVHVAPGQEKHLPHEAWHVAQQRQGRVRPTAEVNGAAVNDDPALEAEADAMGDRAAQAGADRERKP